MTRRVWVRSVSAADAVRATLAAWARDLRGATVVQFAVVLPVLVLLVFGTWSLYTVYSAHQTLCEATWEASRYLQVESPMFPSPEDDTTGEFCYPSGWENIAAQIINTSLDNNPLVAMDVVSGGVQIGPTGPGSCQRPKAPQEQDNVNPQGVETAWFFVRATTHITHPLAFLFDVGDTPGQLKVSCQTTGFAEDEPLRPTGQGGGPRATRVKCIPEPPECTRGPQPTPCRAPPCPTRDPCICR